MKPPNFDLECLIYNCVTYNILLAVIYRPPSYQLDLFKTNLNKLLDLLDTRSDTIAVMGDFNDDMFKESTINNLMANRGYVQVVSQPTTENNTSKCVICLNIQMVNVYVKTTHFDVETVVLPTYFSDHEGIICSFTNKTVQNEFK